MSDKDRWNHQGYQELLRQNQEASNQPQNKYYNSVSKRQNYRFNTSSKQSSSHYNHPWKQSPAFEQPYKNHFGSSHHKNRYNRNFNNSEANHHQQHNYHQHNNKSNHYYSKKYTCNQCCQKEKYQSQENWQHSNSHQLDQHRQQQQLSNMNQKIQERLQKEQEKPDIPQVQKREYINDEGASVILVKRSQPELQSESSNDWRFNQKKLQLHQLQRQDSSITTSSTAYDSNQQDYFNRKFMSQKRFFKRKNNQKFKNKLGSLQNEKDLNQEQQQAIQHQNDQFLLNNPGAQNYEQEEQKLYAPYEDQGIFFQDDCHSVPTQPSPSDLSLLAEISNAPSPILPLNLAKTGQTSSANENTEKKSLEFNPVILKVKLQTQKGPIDVAIRQLDNLTHIATQICQQYNLNQNLIPAIAYQFEYALQTISQGPQYQSQVVMPGYQQQQQQQQQPLVLDNSLNPQNYAQPENNQLYSHQQDTYLNNQEFKN